VTCTQILLKLANNLTTVLFNWNKYNVKCDLNVTIMHEVRVFCILFSQETCKNMKLTTTTLNRDEFLSYFCRLQSLERFCEQNILRGTKYTLYISCFEWCVFLCLCLTLITASLDGLWRYRNNCTLCCVFFLCYYFCGQWIRVP